MNLLQGLSFMCFGGAIALFTVALSDQNTDYTMSGFIILFIGVIFGLLGNM